MKAFLALRVFALVSLTSCSEVEAVTPLPKDVEALISKTRTTDAVYALYTWNRFIRPDGSPSEEWSAEFHANNLHRVETPRDRIIADCKAMTGTALNLVTGEKTQGEAVAKAACGINANAKILSARRTGKVSTPFGDGDGIKIVDPYQIRTYTISSSGALLAAQIFDKDASRTQWLDSEAIHFDTKLPSPNIFSEASLSRSFVAETYRQSPNTK